MIVVGDIHMKGLVAEVGVEGGEEGNDVVEGEVGFHTKIETYT